MAFPADYTKYQDVTIDATKVSADLTDFIVSVDLADLVKAGADVFDTCRTDGGDIRVTKTDGTTELAVEIVTIDTTAKTGLMHFKYTGTTSSSTDTVVRVWYNGTDTLPAVTATYGRDNVWDDYSVVYHLNSLTDSTGNGNTLTAVGSVTTGGDTTSPFGYGTEYDGTDDMHYAADSADFTLLTASYTLQTWLYATSAASADPLFGQYTTAQPRWEIRMEDTTLPSLYARSTTTTVRPVRSTTALASSVWLKMDITGTAGATTDSYFYRNATDVSGTKTSQTTDLDATDRFQICARSTSTFFGAKLAELRLRKSVLASAWITTEYNNQNSFSTFYDTSDEQSGGGGVTFDATTLTAAFSLPTSTPSGGNTQTATVLTAAFSLPASTPTTGVNFTATVLTANFSIPAYTIDAGGNMSFSATVLVADFSIPTYTVIIPNEEQATVLTAAFSIPAYTISFGSGITATVFVADFSIPAYTVSTEFNVIGQDLIPKLSIQRERVIIKKY